MLPRMTDVSGAIADIQKNLGFLLLCIYHNQIKIIEDKKTVDHFFAKLQTYKVSGGEKEEEETKAQYGGFPSPL